MRIGHWLATISAASLVAAIGLWLATGRAGYTRWPNERLERADLPAADGQRGLLIDVGFSDADVDQSPPELKNRFAFGLVPGGFDPPHLLSVATVAAISLLACAVAAASRLVCPCPAPSIQSSKEALP